MVAHVEREVIEVPALKDVLDVREQPVNNLRIRRRMVSQECGPGRCGHGEDILCIDLGKHGTERKAVDK